MRYVLVLAGMFFYILSSPAIAETEVCWDGQSSAELCPVEPQNLPQLRTGMLICDANAEGHRQFVLPALYSENDKHPVHYFDPQTQLLLSPPVIDAKGDLKRAMTVVEKVVPNPPKPFKRPVLEAPSLKGFVDKDGKVHWTSEGAKEALPIRIKLSSTPRAKVIFPLYDYDFSAALRQSIENDKWLNGEAAQSIFPIIFNESGILERRIPVSIPITAIALPRLMQMPTEEQIKPNTVTKYHCKGKAIQAQSSVYMNHEVPRPEATWRKPHKQGYLFFNAYGERLSAAKLKDSGVDRFVVTLAERGERQLGLNP